MCRKHVISLLGQIIIVRRYLQVMKNLLDLQDDKYGLKAIFHAVMGVVIFIAGNILASLPVDLLYSITKLEVSASTVIIRPVLTICLLSLLVFLYIGKVLKRPLREFRICRPKNIIIWSICSFLLPAIVSAFYVFLIPGNFSSSDYEASEIIMIVLRAVFNSCLVAGITEELVFRGLIMHVLEIRWGKAVAVVIPSVLFGMMHIRNMDSPNITDILILVIAGTAVGIMFSLITIQSRSIWPSAMVHGIWNLIIIGRILEISAEPSAAIFSYQITAESSLLTGGAFGIEASLPAIIAYAIVIILALFLMGRNNKGRIDSSPRVSEAIRE